MALKPQGASGLDIDVVFENVGRVVGEVKTVEPYKADDFGAQQKASFFKDFVKLRDAVAARRYLFVTSARAQGVLQQRYAIELAGVELVLLDVSVPG